MPHILLSNLIITYQKLTKKRGGGLINERKHLVPAPPLLGYLRSWGQSVVGTMRWLWSDEIKIQIELLRSIKYESNGSEPASEMDL